MIRRFRVTNYRSLVDVDVTLEPLTVLIGRSGTGKSNFVRAIRRLREVLYSRDVSIKPEPPIGRDVKQYTFEVVLEIDGFDELSYKLTTAGGNISGVLEESLHGAAGLLFHHYHGKWVKDPGVVPTPQAGTLCLGSLTGVREATVAYLSLTRGIGCYDFPGTVLQSKAGDDKRPGYWDNGQNPLPTAGALLDDLSRLSDWSRIINALQSLNANVTSLDLLLPNRDQLQVGYRVGQKMLPLDVAQESEGFRRFLAHLLALYQTPTKRTVIFEHPESGIHPGALESLADQFKRYVSRTGGQVILTTHSPQLLDHFKPEQLAVRVVEMRNGVTRIGPLDPAQADDLRGSLMTPGDLLTADPARLEPAVAAGSAT